MLKGRKCPTFGSQGVLTVLLRLEKVNTHNDTNMMYIQYMPLMCNYAVT